NNRPMAWYRAQLMASQAHSTIRNAMKKACLALPSGASQCQTKSLKVKRLRLVMRYLMPPDASRCQTLDHSHSIIFDGYKPR
ncbi:MAG: hypothetical protein M0Z99_22285, partial [Betaproteobacteria bacterium]|nr:hypothetical protein [Betaproteobacteria bacterium]